MYVISFYLLLLRLQCIRHPRHVQVCPRNNNNNSIRHIIELTRAHYIHKKIANITTGKVKRKKPPLNGSTGKLYSRDISLIALIKVVERIQRIFFLQESPEIPQKRSYLAQKKILRRFLTSAKRSAILIIVHLSVITKMVSYPPFCYSILHLYH